MFLSILLNQVSHSAMTYKSIITEEGFNLVLFYKRDSFLNKPAVFLLG